MNSQDVTMENWFKWVLCSTALPVIFFSHQSGVNR